MSTQSHLQQNNEVQTTSAVPVDIVLPFAALNHTSLPIAGGKGANLGELTQAGQPVPPGFCVTTSAYEPVAEGADLESILADPSLSLRMTLLAATRPDDTSQLAELAEAARTSLLATSMPDTVAEAITESYLALGKGEPIPVAVRSSATAEDLPFASFAGQQDTYLNIVGVDAVLDAVRRCWASLWTNRAVSYRASNGIDHSAVRLAVVVQQMVQASVAGVLFTANPLTGRRRQAVIDASPGLGEAVVSGAVNPDHFVVDTATGEIVTRRVGDKRLAIRSLPGGGTERVTPPDGTDRACLTDDQIRTLAALGDRVEAHYGTPQDTEWAIDATGGLWLTQARPITTLYPLPASAPPPGDQLRVYFCFGVAQGLYRPLTPMGLAGFRLLASSAARILGFPVTDRLTGPPAYAEAGQRLFVDVTGVLRSRAGRALMPRVLDVMEARSAAVLRSLFDEPRLSVTARSRGDR